MDDCQLNYITKLGKKNESKKNHSYMVGILFEECMGLWSTHAHI